ncbi:ABC transporter ATP-binding protein [Chloroflexota bacterium]
MADILKVENLKTYFKTDRGLVKAVDGVSYHIAEREVVGLVGESGCGKSVSQLSVLQLIATPPGEIVDGKVIFNGKDLLKFEANSPEMRSVRGGEIAIVFQEPMTSLNPVLTINRQLTEMMELHLGLKGQEARERVVELLNLVGIPEGEYRIDNYPHQFSGGMRQRVMIAMALSCNPKILIADEPTTALDVTTQAQILDLMKGLIEPFGTSLLIVTHNLGVVARYVQRIYVMYAGRVVESGLSKDIFRTPYHPYTVSLLKCVPRLDEPRGKKLVPISGVPPGLVNMPPTCAFLPRCPCSVDKCRQDPWPELKLVGDQHYASCCVDIEGDKIEFTPR